MTHPCPRLRDERLAVTTSRAVRREEKRARKLRRGRISTGLVEAARFIPDSLGASWADKPHHTP